MCLGPEVMPVLQAIGAISSGVSLVEKLTGGDKSSPTPSSPEPVAQATQAQAATPPTTQADQAPAQAAIRAAGNAGGGASAVGSAGSTLLTGGAGAPTLASMLGKNTILGA